MQKFFNKMFDFIFNKKKKMFEANETAFVINWKFHKNKKWVSALTPYLVDKIVEEFNPIIITNQEEYNKTKKHVKNVISMEPGWAAPKLKYDVKLKQRIGIFASDPHNKVDWFEDYVEANHISTVFSYYHSPFFYHFPNFPKNKFIHLPWAIPDEFIASKDISVRNNDVVIFGGKASEAYDIRNWCREQDNVINFDNSGVENKKMSDEEYFEWLSGFDAIIAAGSSNPMYDLVTPKYFEIASAGALLFGQHCKDLELLGFNDTNSIIFTKGDFAQKIDTYKLNPEAYIDIRKKGRDLIKARHKLSDRIDVLKSYYSN